MNSMEIIGKAFDLWNSPELLTPHFVVLEAILDLNTEATTELSCYDPRFDWPPNMHYSRTADCIYLQTITHIPSKLEEDTSLYPSYQETPQLLYTPFGKVPLRSGYYFEPLSESSITFLTKLNDAGFVLEDITEIVKHAFFTDLKLFETPECISVPYSRDGVLKYYLVSSFSSYKCVPLQENPIIFCQVISSQTDKDREIYKNLVSNLD